MEVQLQLVTAKAYEWNLVERALWWFIKGLLLVTEINLTNTEFGT